MNQASLPAAAALLAWAHLRLVVPRLREPEAKDPTVPLPSYRSLATPATQLGTAGGAAVAGLAALQAPGDTWPVQLVLAGPVAALMAVDLRTTWLPRSLTRWCWALSVAASALPLYRAPDPGHMLLRAAVAVAVTTALFWAVWRLGGTIGFGDVRLVPLLALASSLVSWGCWQRWLLLGTALGALWGLFTALWRRGRPSPLGSSFAYGPPLWCGLWLSLLLS